jgi:hypothetical protein
LQLETYLRISGIKYFRDFSPSDSCSVEAGGQPWISIIGNEDVSGSESCIEFLNKKFNKDFR